MKQSIKYAKKHFNDCAFSPYSTAYVATNEDLRNALKCMPKNADCVLTVAASGDHPMFAKLYGAKYIDTFDISFNARLIMDIKTNALSLLNYEEYCALLTNLYTSKNIICIKNMPQIIEKLTPFEQQYIHEMQGVHLFDKQINFISLPTETEFQKMQQIVEKTFNFIWVDIRKLHTQLNKSYDFMHLSNIFDYLGTYQNCVDVFHSLITYTVPGCNICITCFNKDAEAICEKFVWEQELSPNKRQSWTADKIQTTTYTYVMHRVR